MATWKRILVEGDVTGTGVISVSATAPHNVFLGDPAGLSELTSPVNGNSATADKMLIWDESASEWKWIDTDNFPQIHLGNSNLTQTTSLRTFDVYSGGELRFVNNNSSIVKFKNEDVVGENTSNVIIGHALDYITDGSASVSGIKIEAVLNENGIGDADQAGIWIEAGFDSGSSPEAPIKCVYERAYDLDNFPPVDGDVIADLDFIGPRWSETQSEFQGSYGVFGISGEGRIYSKIRAKIDETGYNNSDGKTRGAIELAVANSDLSLEATPYTNPPAVLRVDSNGVQINTATNNGADSFYLPQSRGSNSQILHTDGAGQTYWAENIPTAYYNSSYAFVNDDLQSPLSYVTTQSFQQIQLNLAQTSTNGVQITEGYNISITTTDNVNLDSVKFDNLDASMSTFSVTIDGVIEWNTYSSGYVQVWCEAALTDADNDQISLFNSQIPTYKQLILPMTQYQASNGSTAPLGGTEASFSYTVPQIGLISGDPVDNIVFKLFVQRIYGTGSHYFRLSSLNISINN